MSANATAAAGSIRDQRRAAGMSQQRLAEIAGCSLSMVRLLESGYVPGSSQVLDRIASVLCPKDDEGPVGEPGLVTTSSPGQGRYERP